MLESDKKDDDVSQKIIVNSETRAEDPSREQSTDNERATTVVPQTLKTPMGEPDTDQRDKTVIEPDKKPKEAETEGSIDDKKPLDEARVNEETDTENKPENTNEKSDEEPGKNSIVNELAEAAASKKQEKTDNDHERAYIQGLEKLVEEKTYNVPIGQLTHKRNTRIIVAVFIVVAVLAAVTIMSLTQ